MDPYLIKRLVRRPWLTICSLLVSAVLCVLIGYLSQYRSIQEQKLLDTRQAYDILCVVTDRKGTKSTGLKMNSDIIEFVTAESSLYPHIEDLRITKEFGYSSAEYGIYTMIAGYDMTPLIGVNSERCADILNPEMSGNVTYFEDGFYESEEYICLVSEMFYSKMHGDTITMDISDPFIDRMKEPGRGRAQGVTFRVAGYYAGQGNRIYIPFGTAMQICSRYSKKQSADSISFIAANNLRLDDIARDAAKYFGAVDPVDGRENEYAITVQDEQYQSVVATLEQNIGRMNMMLPVIMALSLGVGFLISFLSTRNETKTYALMRTLGMNKTKLLLSVITEQLTVAIVAAAISLFVYRAIASVLIYLVCYFVGVLVCTAKTVRVSQAAILKEQE